MRVIEDSHLNLVFDVYKLQFAELVGVYDAEKIGIFALGTHSSL